MASEKNTRRALLAVRTRERRVDLRGPPTRRGPREVEDERAERGRRTLGEAFGGVPSRADFLSKADLFDFFENTNRVERAFILPGGLDALVDGRATVQWYRRNTSVDMPSMGTTLRVVSKDGDAFDLTAEETVAGEFRVKLKNVAHQRTCTGTMVCVIERVVTRNQASEKTRDRRSDDTLLAGERRAR